LKTIPCPTGNWETFFDNLTKIVQTLCENTQHADVLIVVLLNMKTQPRVLLEMQFAKENFHAPVYDQTIKSGFLFLFTAKASHVARPK
jgi:hypothetical protein